MSGLTKMLKNNRFTPADLPNFERALFFEGDRKQKYLVRFATLMFFATVIAAGGIIADSTATVVGAMLIAPLMVPIVATTAALVMGNGKRARHSIAVVAAGVAGVILVSMLLSMITIQVLNFETNSQITGRVTPGMVDLVIALAAGAAAAFAMSRDDIANSLPGVAISIALVPPLCVVGISLGNGVWVDAWGAFLLFLTNCLSILLAGGAVFALLRLQNAVTHDMSHANKRRAYEIIAIGIILVAVPLALSTAKVGRDSYAQAHLGRIVNEWVEQFEDDYVVQSILVSDKVAKIIVTGPELPETISDLGAKIETDVKQVKEVQLIFVPSKKFEYTVGGSD
jgi:uncharacterized hydrophobic protein (TIGR00271 family)